GDSRRASRPKSGAYFAPRMAVRIYALVTLVAAIAMLTVGCAEATDTFEPWGDGPGQKAWEDVKCSTNSDCLTGETCLRNLCQPQRCDNTYQSLTPYGGHLDFGENREILALVNGATARGYETNNANLLKKWDVGTDAIDIAGGNLFGKR